MTNKVWTVMTYPNQGKQYYWKPYDGNNGTFDYANNGAGNKDKQGNWTGVWQAFETRDAFQARKNLTDQSVAAVTVLPIVAVPGIVVAGFGLAEAGTSYLSSLAVRAYASWWRWAPTVGVLGRQVGEILDETGTFSGANKGAGINIALGLKGKNGELDAFAKSFANTFWNEEWRAAGITSGTAESFAAEFYEAANNIVNSGGRIKFNLTGFDLKKALSNAGKGLYDEGVGYTDWEFNQIMSNESLKNSTDFFVDGVQKSLGEINH